MNGTVPQLGHTDFTRYGHAQLVQMLYAGDPAGIVAAGDTWAAVGRSLHDRAADMERQLLDFQNMWSGGAADQYKNMMRELVDGVRQVATTALTIRDLTYTAAEALQDARRRMPAAVDVPAIAPSTVALATTPLDLAAGMSAADVNAARVQQGQAMSILRDHQQAQATSDLAYGQAVRIMTDLAGQYATVEAAMPQAPPTASLPVLVNGVPTLTQPVATPAPGAGAAPPPLFSGVLSSGLAASAAAAGGRFGAALLTAAAKRTVQTAKTTATVGGALPHAPAVGKLTGIGAGSGAMNQPLVSSPGVQGATALAATVGAAAAAGSTGSGSYMPMMPMGMMGAGDGGMDGARRIPPWLVETEDVWGESSVVAPTVIGGPVL